MVADAHVTELERALEHDAAFAQRFDEDPVAAARERGLLEIASEFERYLADRDALAAEYTELSDVETHGFRDSAKARLLTAFVSSAAVAVWLAPIVEAGARKTG
ncbi:MAG: hypothetical protein ICV64_09630 [Thermoleophilia bacterium]|nr:hypothetical protein [Thermoleophilia bacterium]